VQRAGAGTRGDTLSDHATAAVTMAKQYDQAYFDRWYRDPRQRVKHSGEFVRKVRLALSLAEYYLGRPVETVIDIGCGEGHWRAPLLAERPRLRYLGVDGSAYVVARYGRHRNLHRVGFAQLPELAERAGSLLGGDASCDLLVCSDVLHYVASSELALGLPAFARLSHGMAWIEMFCRGDDFVGDDDGFIARPRDWYRRTLAKAGWLALGSNAWLNRDLRERASVLELA
jgi:SAM-dependent methyltransferase